MMATGAGRIAPIMAISNRPESGEVP